MTDVSSINDRSKILPELAIDKKTAAKNEETTSEKDMFMRLMLAQLENQNPLNPQDGTEFVSQLAQFSTLEGIGNINTGIADIGSQYRSSQALQATAMVGRDVLINSNKGYFDGTREITGSVDVGEDNALDAKVTIKNGQGEVVLTKALGNLQGGTTQPLKWDGKDKDGKQLPAGTYSINVEGRVANKNEALSVNLHARVGSVSVVNNKGDMMLNLQGLDSIKSSEVKEIR